MKPHLFAHPRPMVRRVVARLVGFTLIGGVLLLILQLALVLIFFPTGLLLCGTAFLSSILMIPLLMLTVIHPQVRVETKGITLIPMLWRTAFIPWSALVALKAHPLIYDDGVFGRWLHGKNYRLREGSAVVVASSAGVSPLYRIFGGIVGSGLPAFGIASNAHCDYDQLRAIMEKMIASQQEEEEPLSENDVASEDRGISTISDHP